MKSARKPRVSVVTPAYNAQALIGRTIQSVIAQTFSDWEMIVVDDCSTDNTSGVVERWAEKDKRIQLKKLEQNFGGPAGPRNVGVQMARGEYVAFLDSDDIWHPQKLEIQLGILDSGTADFVCSRMKDFSSEKDIAFSEVGDCTFESVSFKKQSVRARIPTSSVIARKELLTANPFREDISYKAVEDYHCWLRLLQTTSKCVKVDAPLLWYRKVEGQLSGSKLYMMRKVFMVHREYPNRTVMGAFFLTACHVFGGFYFRFVKKGM